MKKTPTKQEQERVKGDYDRGREGEGDFRKHVCGTILIEAVVA